MKIKLYLFICCVFVFIHVTKAQVLPIDNLRNYQSINYYIALSYEYNVIFGTSFTQENLEIKLKNFFNQANIPATEITTVKYPYLRIDLIKPNSAMGDSYNSSGWSTTLYAYNYIMLFRLYDVIEGKEVITYQHLSYKNTFNPNEPDNAEACWSITNNLLEIFYKDWKATH